VPPDVCHHHHHHQHSTVEKQKNARQPTVEKQKIPYTENHALLRLRCVVCSSTAPPHTRTQEQHTHFTTHKNHDITPLASLLRVMTLLWFSFFRVMTV
jgi:hypothetical protein